jgi:hypothetical protein
VRMLFFQKETPLTKFARVPDGKVCLNESGELAVTKFAVEPVSSRFQYHTWSLIQSQVWYLPGVAERFGIGL